MTQQAWGPWQLDDAGRTLLHDGGPYGIPLDRLRSADDYEFWSEHVKGKGWGDYRAVNGLNLAFTELNGATA